MPLTVKSLACTLDGSTDAENVTEKLIGAVLTIARFAGLLAITPKSDTAQCSIPVPGLISPCWINVGAPGFVTLMSYQRTRARVPLASDTPGACSAIRCVMPPTFLSAEWYIRVPSEVPPPKGLG